MSNIEDNFFDSQLEKEEDIDYYNFLLFDKNEIPDTKNKDFTKKNIKFEVISNCPLKKKRQKLNKKDLKKRNAENAKKARLRKKEFMNKLIEENLRLKLENKELKRIINNQICLQCKKALFNESNEISIGNNQNSNRNKKLFLFSTFPISLLLIIFFIFHPFPKINNLRNLSSPYEELFQTKLTNLQISNLSLATIHILFGDYYSIVKKKTFLYNENNILYSFQNKGKVRIIKERDITNDLDPNNCADCLVELNQNKIELKNSDKKGIQFKIILTPHKINIDGKNKIGRAHV